MTDSSRERSPNPDVIAHRRASALVAPFLPKLQQWNLYAASSAAREASRLTTEKERDTLRGRRLEVIAEVHSEFVRFSEAIAAEPAHPRIADVDAAFRRLLRTLDF
jgi:hypothetical protein